MLSNRIKSFTENLSSIRFLGIKDFLIVDIDEHSANIVLLRSKINPLKILNNSTAPDFNILSQRECEVDEDTFDLNREIKILIDNYSLKNVVLVLIINKYKHFNISLQKDARDNDEDTSVDDLIRKQLPPNLNNNDFILQYEKISEDESLENYLAAITRKQDVEKYLDVINNDLFQMKLVLPSIFTVANQNTLYTLIELQKAKLVHYQLTNEGKISEDEYFIESDYEDSVSEKLQQIIGNIESSDGGQADKSFKLFVHTRLELTPVLSKIMLQLNSEREIRIAYDFGQSIKHKLAYNSLFSDNVFNFNLEKHFQSKQSFDIERAITTRLVVTSFSILLLLLVFLNGLNWFTNNSLSDISLQNQNRQELELLAKQINEQNEQLKSDIKSVNKIKYKGEKVSGVLKILSTAAIDNLLLTDLKLKRNSSDKYEVKLSGESFSKDEVIKYIKNLESNPELSKIELIWMDKKRVDAYNVQESNKAFQFSINLIYDEDKNS
ncbi:MAG: PilN domain-containing protein [Ignavibacterium sp.]|nr:PilN domain-containing protein [Ignavibacterium sp.]